MEKTISITLSGLIFNIEEDAYNKLDKYLESIRVYYDEKDGKEILVDIESSVAEKFSDKIKGKKKVITEKDVEEVIKIMGTVDEFDSEEKTEKTEQAGKKEDKKQSEERVFSLGKRLYRDTDDVVIVGVCSGIASYFGIDPIIIRIIFVLLVFANGVGVLAYLILWMVMPKAKTNAQRLEMQGKPVNVKKLDETMKEKARIAKDEGREAINRIRMNKGWLYKIINFPIQIIKSIWYFFIKLLSLIWPITRISFGSIFIISCFFSILGLTIVSGVMIFNINSPYLISDFPLDTLISEPMYYVAVLSVYFLAVIPIAFLMLLGLTMIRNKNTFKLLSSGLMIGIWMLAIVAAVVAAGELVPRIINVIDENTVQETVYREYDYKDFNKLYLGANTTAKIKQGDEFNIVMIGREKDLERLSLNIEDEQLQIIQGQRKDSGKLCVFCFNRNIEMEITMPELKSFVSFQMVDAEIEGFKAIEKFSIGESSQVRASTGAENLEIYIAGINSRLELTGTSTNINATLEGISRLVASDLMTEEIKINQEGLSRVYLTGETEKLVAEIGDSADLFAKDLKAKSSYIKVYNRAEAEIYALDILEAIAQGHGRIYYKGNPEVTIKTSEEGRIEKINDFEFDMKEN